MNQLRAWMNRNTWFIAGNILLSFFLVNILASAIPWQLDLTRDGVNSVSESSHRVLSRLENTLYVEAYITQDLPGEILTMLRPSIAKLEAFGRSGGGRVKVKILNPDTPEKMEEAEKNGIPGIPVEEARVDQISQRMGYFGIRLKMGDQSTVIGLVENGGIVQDLEYRLLREIKRMLRTKDHSGIALLTGDGLVATERWRSRSDQHKDNYYGIRTLMEKDLGLIEEVGIGEPVPPIVDRLIVAGLPELDETARYQLDQFLLRGGNLILMLKSFDFDNSPPNPMMMQLGLGGSQGGGFATVDAKKVDAMNAWLARYGLQIQGKIFFEPEYFARTLDMEGKYLGLIRNPAWAVYSRETNTILSHDPALAPVNQLVFPWYSGLDVREAAQESVKYETLVATSSRGVMRDSSSLDLREIQEVGTGPDDEWTGRNIPVAVLAKGRFKSAFTTETLPGGVDRTGFLESQEGPDSSILFVGTPYLVSDVLLQNDVNAQAFQLNQAFLLNMLESMGGDQDLLEARARVPEIFFMPRLGEGLEALFSWFHVLLFPVILGIFGAMRLIKRSKKRGMNPGGNQ